MTDLFNQNNTEATKTSSYLFQIHQSNFNCYFDNGILTPSNYIKKDLTEEDIQCQYSNHLVLTEDLYIDTSENQLFFKVLLTNKEVEKLIKRVKGVYLYDKPLPISRIEAIYYTNELTKLKIQKFVENGAVSYLPFSIMNKLPAKITKRKGKALKQKDYNSKDYLEVLNRFNKIMGMFSYMKNTNLYYGFLYSNYSSNYLSALATINKYVREQYDFNKGYFISFQRILNTSINDDIKPSKLELLKTIYNDSVNIDKNYVESFFQKYVNELPYELQGVLKQVLQNLKDPLKKKNNLQVLSSDTQLSTFFELYYIANYGERMNGTNKLKSAIAKELPYKNAEITLALLGIYYGYKKLDAYDTIDTSQFVNFKHLINPNHHVKFKLDNRLDYVTIESIYQFTFNNITDNGEFDYLISPENHSKTTNYDRYKKNPKYTYRELKVFDKNIINVQPVTQKQIEPKSNEKILSLLKKYPNHISMNSTIFSWVAKSVNNGGIIRYDKAIYINKEELMKYISKGNLKNENYLLECIEFDIRHKNYGT